MATSTGHRTTLRIGVTNTQKATPPVRTAHHGEEAFADYVSGRPVHGQDIIDVRMKSSQACHRLRLFSLQGC